MFKYILSLLAVISFNASAQQIILPEPVKEQSGFYLVQPDYVFNFTHILRNTGVAIEIYDKNEQHNIIEYTIPEKFIFGGYFDNNGFYITFQGNINPTHPTTFDVTLAYVALGITQILGEGTITFDSVGRGNSHVADFVFMMDEEFSVFPKYGLYGKFLRISGVDINKCIPVLLSKYTEHDYVNCNK